MRNRRLQVAVRVSNCIINIRAWDWHFQVTRYGKVRVVRNSYHRNTGWRDGRFAIYDFWPFK